jgi:DNA/RNA endonuclease G (NUC1)/uncharacterized protein YjdB
MRFFATRDARASVRLRQSRRTLPLLLAAVPLFALQACDRQPVAPEPGEATAAVRVEGGSAGAMAGAQVVISQVYGGGGNAGAPYTHDFVELFNRGDEPVSLDGMSIQYASATGTGNFGSGSNQLTALTGTIAPGGYFLVQQAGGTTGAPLPTADLVDPVPINLAAGAGKVALVTGTSSLGCNGGSTPCPAEALARIVDLVGYGTANFYEGSAAARGLTNSTAALRAAGGCTDTDDNAADFSAVEPAPRTSASPAHGCGGPAAPPATVVVTPDPASVAVGATVQLSARAEDADGQPVGTSFTWTSSDQGVATVNVASGLVTGVSAGSASITATAANGVGGSAQLTVTAAEPPPGGASGVVISQVYGGGGNSGATWTHDFIELLNTGDVAVDLTGWSVQYASATGTSWTWTALSGTLQPGRYYLIQQAQGSGGTTPLPTPDATGTLAMAATNGKVALVSSATALSGACPLGAAVIDFVGFGSTANCFEGSGPTPTLSNTTAALRERAGCQDTDDNKADFTAGAPTPRNRATSPNSCAPPAPVTPTGLVITEFLSDPDGVDAFGEWFELYNAGDSDVNLFGWQLRSGSSSGVEAHTIGAPVIVPAGGFVVLGNNADPTTNGGAPVAYSYGGDIILNNSSTDWLAVKRPDGTLEDSVSYSARNDAGMIVSPQFMPAAATSRVLIDLNVDNTIAASANWQNSTIAYGDGRNRGSPGWGAYGVAGPVTAIIVTPPTASVLQGGTAAFTAYPIDALGRVSSASVSWSSADAGIATVNAATGVATGVTQGHVDIVAAAGAATGSARLSVVDPNAPAAITVSFDPTWLPVGYTKRPFYTVTNHGGTIIAADVTWTVSDPALAEIVVYDGRAYVSTLRAGTIQVIATAANGVTGSRPMTILPGDAPTPAVYRNHIEFGMPLRGGAPDAIIVEKAGFISSWNPARGGPNWVSWNLNGTQFGSSGRCNCFSPDLTLPAGTPVVFDTDYIGGGYDRGHMVQSESRTSTEQENAATFLFTNILPQAPVNNQVSWLAFENHLNNLARTGGREIYVIAGGEYAPNAPTVNDAGRIHIPDFTWKIAVILAAGQGLADVQVPADMEVIAVRMPNLISTAVNTSAWQNFVTTVDAIEEAVDYDFLEALPDWIERIVESGTRPPVAVSGGPYDGVVGIPVAFDGSASSDPDAGDVLSFAWSFGDGAAGTGDTPTHSYAAEGVFNVRLIVNDQYGAADTTFTTATILPRGAVQGGGTLEVPAGAITGSPATAGRASLAFTAAHRGEGVSGQLELHLNAAAFRFSSDSVDGLVLQDDRATLRGSGRLRGSAEVLSYVLEARRGSDGTAAVRIVIRNSAGAVVFDNAPGAAPGTLGPVSGSIQFR